MHVSVARCIATHLIREAGVSRKTARTGAAILIERCCRALNLNIRLRCEPLDFIARLRAPQCGRRASAHRSQGWIRAPLRR
ncbi:MAG: hypothetical protein P8090_19275 [Gammaproteobacteria bacterium]